jgi:uncharacterized protein (DUF983 family)
MKEQGVKTMNTVAVAPAPAATPFWTGLRRGFSGKCPNCGEGTLFYSYLKVNPLCPHCGLALGEFRADDAPPYFTILIVGHIIVPAMLILEQLEHPAEWIHMALWLPLTLGLSLFLLPRIKGAVIGAQWSAKIRG